MRPSRLARGATTMRLTTAVSQFLDATRFRLADATRIGYGRDLQHFIGWALAKAPDSVLVFTAKLIEDYLVECSKRNLHMATLGRRRSALGEFARWGHERRLFADNPILGVPRVRRPKTLPKPFTAEERSRLLALPLRGKERVLRSILYYSGFRVSEALAIRVGDFAGEVRTLRTRGKGDKERSVPVPPELASILRTWIAEETDRHPQTFLFAKGDGSGKHLDTDTAEYFCKKWGRLAEVERCTPHRFRHDYATRLLERGADIRSIQKLMGHESIQTTADYLEVVDAKLRDVVALLSDVSPSRFPEGGFNDPTS